MTLHPRTDWTKVPAAVGFASVVLAAAIVVTVLLMP